MTAKSIDMDMDQVVDYKAEDSQAIKKHTVSGSQLNGLCPFHDDRESSFSVNLQTGQYTCFACGELHDLLGRNPWDGHRGSI